MRSLAVRRIFPFVITRHGHKAALALERLAEERLGRNRLDEVLSWVRGKTAHSTGLELFIPILPELRRIIDAAPSRHLTFLTTAFGKPFTAAGFGNWFRDQCNAAGLPHCTFHGLRKAAARRLAEHGCTSLEIMAITGHATLKEVERYTQAANRKRL